MLGEGEKKRREITIIAGVFLIPPQKLKNGEQHVFQLCHQGKKRKTVVHQENELSRICTFKTTRLQRGGGGRGGNYIQGWISSLVISWPMEIQWWIFHIQLIKALQIVLKLRLFVQWLFEIITALKEWLLWRDLCVSILQAPLHLHDCNLGTWQPDCIYKQL